MARLLSSGLLLTFVHLCSANPLVKRWDDTAVHHAWTEVPRGWELVGPAPADQNLTLSISLKQDGVDQLTRRALQISNPSDLSYGAHLTKDEVEALIAPHSDSIELVDSWLAYHEIDPSTSVSRSRAGDWISVELPIKRAEKLLGTKYNVYKHITTSEKVVRTLEYSLPRSIHDHINVVTPTTYFGHGRSLSAPRLVKKDGFATRSVAPGICDNITPECVAAAYNITGYVPQSVKNNNTMAVVGFHNDSSSHADLKTFLSQYASNAAGADFKETLINEAETDQNSPTSQGNTAIQYSIALTYPTPILYQSTGGLGSFQKDVNTPKNTNEPYLQWLQYALGLDDIPQTFSISYSEDEQNVPENYANIICGMFLQLGARGSSVIVSSGSSGVGGHNTDDAGLCVSNDSRFKTTFLPTYPASCEWVTSVGATTGVPEKAISYSGGGFSNYAPTPDYQKDAVALYLKTLGDQHKGAFTPTGRGIPDVAALGHGVDMVINGMVSQDGATGSSTAIFASVISLLNDYRLSNGQPSLGFLNPWLYSNASSAFNDITSGSNAGCGLEEAFTAVTGWDPVTGLGSPNFGLLKQTVLDECDRCQ